MEYPKINSLFKRDLSTHKFLEEYSSDQFKGQIWRVEEKIDGTNIRIYIKDGIIKIKGRRDDSLVPQSIIDFIISKELGIKSINLGYDSIELFGEGFGGKIQKGKDYRNNESFILFDVRINKYWFIRDEVYSLANKLDLEHPFDFGIMDEQKIIELIKSNPLGRYNNNGYPMEGIIARSEKNHLIVTKLKVKDFEF